MLEEYLKKTEFHHQSGDSPEYSIMPIVMFIGKFIIAFCIDIATGKLINGGLVDFGP